MALEGSKSETKDLVEDINGLKVVVEKDLMTQFNGFKIDFSDGWLNKGFTIIPGIGGATC